MHFANFTLKFEKRTVLEFLFSEKYWGLVVLGSLVLASGMSFLMYFRNRDASELSSLQRKVLFFLRFASVFMVAVLLAVPLLKTVRKIVQNPVIIVAVDNSLSIKGIQDQEQNKQSAVDLLDAIQKGLSEKFDMAGYTFGEKVQRSTQPDFSEKISNYGEALNVIHNNHFNQNIGALIILGDGIFNLGDNPLNVADKFSFPVFSLAMGDTTIYADAGITSVRINKTAFLGNKFPVEADIRYHGLANKTLRFSIEQQGRQIYEELIQTRENDGFRTIPVYLDALEEGLQHYTAKVETVDAEINKTNNTQRFVINILENKQKILILSNGSHPDAGVLKQALEDQINYEVTLITREPYPADIKDFNLIVLVQMPSSSQSGRTILEEASGKRIPLLFILGSQTHIPQFNLLGLGAEIRPQAGNMEDAQPILNKSFANFTLSNQLKEMLERFPPLKVPFARYNLDPSWNVIAHQRIRNIETDRPLMAIASKDGKKTGIIFGEGLWRWRMYNYLFGESHHEFSELVDKMVQYLSLRDNQDNFIIDFKPVYQETESVIMTAEVYNDAFEPIITPEVNMVLSDSANHEFNYVFDRGNRFYRLDAGRLAPGNYRFSATVTIGDKEYVENGQFTVMPVNLEQTETRANHRLLYQIAYQTGGGFYLPEEVEDLIQQVSGHTRIKPFSYFQTQLSGVLNLKWVFFVILIIIGTEWFLRKFWGIY